MLIFLDALGNMKLEGYNPSEELRKNQTIQPNQYLLDIFNRTQYIGN